MKIFDLENEKLDLMTEEREIIGGILTETYAYTDATYTYAATDAETGMASAYADSMGIGNSVSVFSDTYSLANDYITKSSANANAVAIVDENLYWSNSNSNSVNISTNFRKLSLGYSVSTGGSM